MNMRNCCVSFRGCHWLIIMIVHSGAPRKMGFFSVKSFYKWLFKCKSDAIKIPYKQIWKVKVPPWVSFFVWEASRECILTIDKLRRRDKVLVNAYYLCKRNEETCNHVLLWCPWVYKLWMMVFGWLGISCVMAGSVREELWAWKSISSRCNFADMILLTTIWTVWKKRNRTFDGMDDVNGYDILKNWWFQILYFFLMSHSPQSTEDFRNLFDKLLDL